MSGQKKGDEDFKPRGLDLIRPLQMAVRNFAPDINFVVDQNQIDRQLNFIGEIFNVRMYESKNENPRFKDLQEELSNIRTKAKALIGSIECLQPLSREMLLVPLKIASGDETDWWRYKIERSLSRTDHIDLLIEQIQVLAESADEEKKRLLECYSADKGGARHFLSVVRGSPRDQLVQECFWLIINIFGAEAGKKCTQTPDRENEKSNLPRPLFGRLVKLAFMYAVGDRYAEGDDDFKEPLKKELPKLRAKLAHALQANPSMFPRDVRYGPFDPVRDIYFAARRPN